MFIDHVITATAIMAGCSVAGSRERGPGAVRVVLPHRVRRVRPRVLTSWVDWRRKERTEERTSRTIVMRDK